MPDQSQPTMDAPVQQDEGLPAAPAPGDGRGVTGRDRMRSALLHPRRNQVVVAVLLAAVGFAAVVQVRTNDVDDSLSTLREQDLVDVLSSLAGTSQRARNEIDRLEGVKRGLQTDSEDRKSVV